MKEKSKGQGHLIVANGGGGAALAMVRSLRELEWREEKGEERGSLDEEGVWTAVSPK